MYIRRRDQDRHHDSAVQLPWLTSVFTVPFYFDRKLEADFLNFVRSMVTSPVCDPLSLSAHVRKIYSRISPLELVGYLAHGPVLSV